MNLIQLKVKLIPEYNSLIEKEKGKKSLNNYKIKVKNLKK